VGVKKLAAACGHNPGVFNGGYSSRNKKPAFPSNGWEGATDPNKKKKRKKKKNTKTTP